MSVNDVLARISTPGRNPTTQDLCDIIRASDGELIGLLDGIGIPPSLNLSQLNKLSRLPHVEMFRSVVLENSSIKEMPDDMMVWGWMVIDSCYDLIKLPKRVEVGSFLKIVNCPLISKLPEELIVHNDLTLSYLQVKRLPRKLHVGGKLRISHCPNLPTYPNIWGTSPCPSLTKSATQK